MIIFDTETTGLPSFKGDTPLDQQPKIIEFCAIKLCDKTLEEKARIEFLINPQQGISAEITALTGLKDEDFKDTKPFSEHFETLCDFFLGEKHMIAHNMNFDKKLMKFEMERIFKTTRFPWAPMQHCTMLTGMRLNGNKWPKLPVLHKILTGEEYAETHRAKADVEATARCVVAMIKNSMLKIN